MSRPPNAKYRAFCEAEALNAGIPTYAQSKELDHARWLAGPSDVQRAIHTLVQHHLDDTGELGQAARLLWPMVKPPGPGSDYGRHCTGED